MPRYATPADLEVSGIPLASLSSIDKTVQQRMLDRVSSEIDLSLRDQITLPIVGAVDPILTDICCRIGAWRLLALRGFDPDSDGDKVVRQLERDAQVLLKEIANGQKKIAVTHTAPESLQPDVASNTPRGYGDITGDGSTDYPAVPGIGNWGT